MRFSNSHIIKTQYLGFRFHGWQKQKDLKSVHEAVDKTLSFIFEHFNFRTIGVGRTDSKVSALNYPLQIFIDKDKLEKTDFVERFNINAPNDIKCLSVEECHLKFNVINSPKIKEYHYNFSFGKKQHPFSAPIHVAFQENLNLELMKKGAKLFEGTHHFHKYCSKPKGNTILERTINQCEITKNTFLTASFLPADSYTLIVRCNP